MPRLRCEGGWRMSISVTCDKVEKEIDEVVSFMPEGYVLVPIGDVENE